MEVIADFATRILRNIGDSGQNRIAFTKTKDADQAGEVKLNVTLGIVPDYLYDGEGLRIDGVREGKPAEAAGLKKGDIILKMGDYAIKEIYSYMDALNKFHPGDKASVVIKRDGKEMTVSVQF